MILRQRRRLPARFDAAATLIHDAAAMPCHMFAMPPITVDAA